MLKKLTTTRARRSRRDAERRDGIASAVAAVVIVFALFGSAWTSVAVSRHNGRVQAVERARKMDGGIFTIKRVSYNFLGDTRLHLQNERGEDCGWVMLYMNNPLTREVNPIFLALSDKRYDPLPFPMKVRARYRPEAWTDAKLSSAKENYTGSFLAFEKLDD